MQISPEQPAINNEIGSQNTVSNSNVAIDNVIGRDLNQSTINQYAADERFNVTDLPCPYPGLESYTEANARYFAGREELVTAWCKKITPAGVEQTLLFVYGASGSGKSSFVRAGLVPALQQFYQKSLNKTVRRFYFTPNKLPKAEFLRVLRAENIAVADDASVQQCFAALSAQTSESTVNLLVIDQGEELFTQSDNAQCREFLQALAYRIPFVKSRTHIIVTFRADFLAELYPHQHLYQHVIQTGCDLRAMTADEIKSAIRKPLEEDPYKGKEFVPLLVEELATVTAQQSSFLPLLQMTLVEIWRTGKLWLESKQFLHDALIRYADGVLHYRYDESGRKIARPAAEQTQMLNLLTELVDINEDSKRDTRRYRRSDELFILYPQAKHYLDHLINNRLLTTSDQRDGTRKPIARVTLAHEILLQQWIPLQTMVETRREKAVQFKQFERLYADWQTQQLNNRFLLSAGRLAQVQELMQQSPQLFNSNHREFIQQSKRFSQNVERTRRRWRTSLIIILALLALVYPIIWVYRLSLKQQARTLNQPVFIATGTLQLKDNNLESVFIPINAFQIDTYEVSNHQYDLCIRANGCDELQNPALFQSNLNTLPDVPVVNVTAFEAMRYCQWLDGSLPSSTEWGYVVRGSENRKYPWGNGEPIPINDFVNIDALMTLTRTLAPVNDYTKGTTPEPDKVFNLLGNAMEWTASDFSSSPLSSTLRWNGNLATVPIQLSVRGSAFTSSWEKEVTSEQFPVIPSEVRRDLGFRCRYDP